MKALEYKGYIGIAELSEDDGVFFGKLAFIRDLVTYESDTAKGLVRAFHQAVDGYLQDCADEGREPDRPFKGQFNVRTSPELHRAYALKALKSGRSLNDVVTRALERSLGERRSASIKVRPRRPDPAAARP